MEVLPLELVLLENLAPMESLPLELVLLEDLLQLAQSPKILHGSLDNAERGDQPKMVCAIVVAFPANHHISSLEGFERLYDCPPEMSLPSSPAVLEFDLG